MNRFKILLTIFCITFFTILVEILYTRVFSVIYFSSFAFLMISLALFGYGLSGFYISFSKIAKKKNAIKYVENFIFLFAITLPVIFKITLTATIDFVNLFNPLSNFLILLLNLLVLLIPFFCAGIALAIIFTLYSSEIGKLYFIDLIGAGLGGLAIIPLISGLGPARIIVLISVFLAFIWFLISQTQKIKKIALFSIIILAFLGLFKYSEKIFPIVPKGQKREYIKQYNKGLIEYSKWSPINKIDIGPAPFFNQDKKTLWINGGTQQSSLVKTTWENIDRRKPLLWIHEAIPYQLAKKGSALIIGSAGGFEVLCALSNDFKEIIAVEMGPEICNVVKHTYSEYIGHLFRKKRVTLLNDEGRSVLKRSIKKYDVIQMVNSHNTDALLSGGLSIAETYIYTVESFKDYWSHLKDGGFLSIVHLFGERMFSTAFQALREMGIKEPEKKLFVIQAKGGFNFFFMKKGDFSQQDLGTLTEFMNRMESRRNIKLGKEPIFEISYTPKQIKDNIYTKLASSDYKEIIKTSSVNIAPVYDNSPYFNQPNKIGQFKFSNVFVKGMAKNVINRNLVYSNSVYLSIMGVSLLFALIFIYLPLKIKVKDTRQNKPVIYFFLIGIAFIMVEIVLIKIFQLFLGNPAYSISAIIFSLLISSGIGSLLSKKINTILKDRTIVFLSILIFIILVVYAIFLFKFVYLLIHLNLALRFVISLLLISVLGIPMGVFFPTGLSYLGTKDNTMIGWAWGANSFATVLGSVMTVIIAINWGFSIAFTIAAVAYLGAGLIFHRHIKQKQT